MIVGLVGCLVSDILTAIHNQRIGSLYGEKTRRHSYSPILKMSVNSVSTIMGVASCIITRLCYGVYPELEL